MADEIHGVYWRCFHCGETFTRPQERWAREHFGARDGDTPVCLMRVPGEGSLLSALRKAQNELASYRNEDTELMRALSAMESDHAAALQREEDKGYARGLRDAKLAEAES
jgi:hypothetical protein